MVSVVSSELAGWSTDRELASLLGSTGGFVFAATRRWADVRDHRDLAGRPRFVTARLAR